MLPKERNTTARITGAPGGIGLELGVYGGLEGGVRQKVGDRARGSKRSSGPPRSDADPDRPSTTDYRLLTTDSRLPTLSLSLPSGGPDQAGPDQQERPPLG